MQRLPHSALDCCLLTVGQLLPVTMQRASGPYMMETKLTIIFWLVTKAASASNKTRYEAAVCSLGSEEPSEKKIQSPTLWWNLRVEMVEPLVLELEAEDAAAAGDAAKQAQLAVDVAEALATRPCAHPCCASIAGAREAEIPRDKLCSGCRAVRYCGPGCQKADWPAHRAACRELQRRRS